MTIDDALTTQDTTTTEILTTIPDDIDLQTNFPDVPARLQLQNIDYVDSPPRINQPETFATLNHGEILQPKYMDLTVIDLTGRVESHGTGILIFMIMIQTLLF